MVQHYPRLTVCCLLLAGLLLSSGCAKSSTVSSNNSAQSSVSSGPAASSAASSESSAVSLSPSNSGSSNSIENTVSLPPPVKSAPVNAVKQSAKSDYSYFDDAVFIGDSVSLKLKNYITIKRKTQPDFMGKAQFLTAGSMGSANALKAVGTDSIHPAYNGQKMLLEDSVAAMGAKKVYIMLGANDIALYGIEGSVKNMEKLLANIKTKSPDAMILVQSATPILKEKQMKQLNNPNLIAYDNALSKMCQEKNYYFVDVASALRDEDGNLPPEFCSDPNILGIHFTDKACEIWIQYLLTHTVKQ
ncbi:GDSL-type esterase/lipase family protein [Caproiciproducens sp. LBM24188]